MLTSQDITETFISVDIETAGPNPGSFAMLSIGACLAFDVDRTFYCELKPDKPGEDSEALSIHGLSLEQLTRFGEDPAGALQSFTAWIWDQVPEGSTPVFTAYNAPFEWTLTFHPTTP